MKNKSQKNISYNCTICMYACLFVFMLVSNLNSIFKKHFNLTTLKMSCGATIKQKVIHFTKTLNM